MKGYRKFIVSFSILLTIYIIAEINRPKLLNWTVTLSRQDKNPFGAYVLYQLLPSFFPGAELVSSRRPIYNTLEEGFEKNSAYFLIERDLEISKEDCNRLLKYVAAGNYVFVSGLNIDKILADTLKFKTGQAVTLSYDSFSVKLINPSLPSGRYSQIGPMTMGTHFKKVDSSRSVLLGENNLRQPNFISMTIGKGKLFVHTLPLCFSNIFLLRDQNAAYASGALSYLPKNLKTIYWDEYYKLGPEGSTSPLRFILQDPWLKWAYRIGLLAMLTLLFFESKRRQRIIPIVKPLRNSTLDFVKTVGNVYYHHRNNKNLAVKKINHFTDYIRTRFYLQANPMNEKFVADFTAKSGLPEDEVNILAGLINDIQDASAVDDKSLLELNRIIDHYYDLFG
ncbi:MAG: DUF4350 domain-containing protein [Chitinophagaceae bacterium]